jgi:hypothetical protein
MTSFHARSPEPPRVGPNRVLQISATSLPMELIQASPSGSVMVSICSWLIVDNAGSAVLALGRGLSDWQ